MGVGDAQEPELGALTAHRGLGGGNLEGEAWGEDRWGWPDAQVPA